ncbi:hypothetical protein AVEN_179156-1, partial [Araneus ventricosus]
LASLSCFNVLCIDVSSYAVQEVVRSHDLAQVAFTRFSVLCDSCFFFVIQDDEGKADPNRSVKKQKRMGDDRWWDIWELNLRLSLSLLFFAFLVAFTSCSASSATDVFFCIQVSRLVKLTRMGDDR